MSAMLIILVLFTEGNENAVEEGGEEQQGPQKPKKVSVLFLIISICPNVLIVV